MYRPVKAKSKQHIQQESLTDPISFACEGKLWQRRRSWAVRIIRWSYWCSVWRRSPVSMSYEFIDATLLKWARKNQLNWLTQYRDEEVRTVIIVDRTGREFQLWVDPPGWIGINVHVWNFRKKRKKFRASEVSLELVLDEALATIRSWSSSSDTWKPFLCSRN